MRVVMSSSPDWGENFLIFHITYTDDKSELFPVEQCFFYFASQTFEFHDTCTSGVQYKLP